MCYNYKKLRNRVTSDSINGVNMLEINKYLSAYWSKYPQEQSCDPSYLDIQKYILSGGKYFLKDNIFIIYILGSKAASILHYWCDMGSVPSKTIRKTLKNHKEFIKSINVPVYSESIKDLFKRDYLVSFDKKINLWRWI